MTHGIYEKLWVYFAISIHQLSHADFIVMYIINIFLVLHFDITHGIQEIFFYCHGHYRISMKTSLYFLRLQYLDNFTFSYCKLATEQSLASNKCGTLYTLWLWIIFICDISAHTSQVTDCFNVFIMQAKSRAILLLPYLHKCNKFLFLLKSG